MPIDFDPELVQRSLTLPDGRTLQYVDAGDEAPVVVFEAGLGACASSWTTVQRIVASHARTISYDRAGYGGSSTDHEPRTIARICTDLDALLHEVSPHSPVVLVAHSYGGPIVRGLAAQHPGKIAGVVLVDVTRSAIIPARMARLLPRIKQLVISTYGIGLGQRITKANVHIRPNASTPDGDLASFERDLFSLQSARASLPESRELAATLSLLAQWESQGLPAVPVVSLVGGAMDDPRERRVRTTLVDLQRPGDGPAHRRRIPHRGRRRALHPQEAPEAIATSIIDVLTAARTPSPRMPNAVAQA